MAKSKQVTVWVESTPGQLARIAQALAQAKINITAFTAYGTGGESPVRMLVTSPTKARQVLRGLGLRVTEEEVLRVTLADKPGKLGELGARLHKAGINAQYAYGTLAKGSKKADIVMGVSDLAGAVKALRGL